jgi:NAD(P)-dependent dehydrogenase (short-subunit alcohol dehydrogenase family)
MSDINYDLLLRSNLQRVFNERNPDHRARALAELYVDDPVMFEPDGVVRGREAISAVAGKLLDQFGPTFSLSPTASRSVITILVCCAGMLGRTAVR